MQKVLIQHFCVRNRLWTCHSRHRNRNPILKAQEVTVSAVLSVALLNYLNSCKFPTESVERQSCKKPNIQYISCELTSNNSNNTDSNGQLAPATQPSIIPADNYSYVQLTAVHDYNYPVDDPISSVLRRDSTCSLKKRPPLDMPESIIKDSTMIKARLRCRWVNDSSEKFKTKKLIENFNFLDIAKNFTKRSGTAKVRVHLRRTA